MLSLILLASLSAAAPTSPEPVTIRVPVHTLANTQHKKGFHPAQDLLERGQHAMSARLRADGLRNGGVAMAKVHDGNAREEIEVFLAVRIPQAAACALDKGKFPLAVGVDNETVVQ